MIEYLLRKYEGKPGAILIIALMALVVLILAFHGFAVWTGEI